MPATENTVRTSLTSFIADLPDLPPELTGIPANPQPQPKEPNGATGQTGGTPDGGNVGGPSPTTAAPAPAPETKTPPKTEATPPAKPEAKPEPKPEVKPEVKAEVKPAEVKPEESPEEKWPRSAADWKNYKAKSKEREDALKTEIETLKKQAKEAAEKRPTDPDKPSPEVELTKAENDRLRKENEEYSKRLQVLDVTAHPKFQSHFNNRVSAQVELAKRLVGSEKGEEIAKILTLPDSDFKNERLESFLGDLSPIVTSRLGGVLNNLESIEAEKREAIAQAQAEREKWQSEQSTKQKQAQESAEKTWKSVVAKLQNSENGLAVYQLREGDTEWNNGVLDRISTARKLIEGKNDPQIVAEAALHAVAFPAILQHVQARETAHRDAIAAKDAEIEGLKKQVSDLAAVQPTVQKGGKVEAEPVPVKLSGMDPRAAAKAWRDSFARAMEGGA